MSYPYRYCPTCATRRIAPGYTCSVCGGPVRHASRAAQTVTADDPAHHRPFGPQWRVVSRADAEQAAEQVARA